MVLMPVGKDDPFDLVLPFDQPGIVRNDEVDPRRGLGIRKQNTRIYNDQPLSALGTVAVDVHVHANLARSSERGEEELAI